MAVRDDVDAIGDLGKRGLELDPAGRGLDVEARVNATHEDAAFDQNIVRSFQSQQTIGRVGRELTGQVNTGIHLIALVPVVIGCPLQLHDVGGGNRPEDTQLVRGRDDDIPAIILRNLDPAFPHHTGQDLTVNVDGLVGKNLDQRIRALGGHGSGNLHQFEERIRDVNTDRGPFTTDVGLPLEHD